MNEIDITKKFIGSAIKSSVYGEGIVQDFFFKNNSYFISASFFIDGSETNKSFLASTAFPSGSLRFEDENYTKAIKLILDKKELPQKQSLSGDAQKTVISSAISSNDIVNIFIESVLNNKSFAVDLLEFYDDKEFEADLCGEAFNYLERIINGSRLGEAHKACIVVALTLIALKYYDGDLHTYIESKFREYSPKTEAQYTKASIIQGGVYKVVGEYRKRVKYFDAHSYVAVPLVLSCVPHYRVKDLFRISYDIYKRKLLFDEDVSNEQIEEKVSETLKMLRRKDLISDSDTIKGTNYLMSKYTQSCIYSGCGIDALTKIISHCIRLIISYLTRPEDSFRVEPYYTDGFNSWVNSFEADDKEKAKYENNRTISQPILKLVGNEVHLVTGEFSMDDSYDPNDIRICISQGDELLHEYRLDDPNDVEFVNEDEALSGYIINRKEYALSASPLDHLNYTILCGDHIIFNSKAKLYRTNLFFDGKGHEIKPGSEYSGELFVVTHENNAEEYGESIVEVFHGKDFYISSIEVNNQDVFRFDGEPYVFYKISGSKLISYEVPWAAFTSVEGNRLPIYNDVTILFPASCDKEDVYLEIDGQKYSYDDDSEIYYKIRLFSKEYGENWAYTVRIFNLTAGYHVVKLFNSISGKQIKGASFGIIYDPEMWKSYIAKDDKGILYDLSGSFVENQQLIYEYGINCKELHAFVKNLGYGSLLVYPSSISYSMDGETWYDIDRKIYLCDIPESTKSIQICGPAGMDVFYVDKAAEVKSQKLSLEQNKESPTSYNLFLGFLRTIHGKKSARLSFEYGKRCKFVNVWFNPYVISEECVFDFNAEKSTYSFRFVFEGNSKLKVQIKPTNSEMVIASKVVQSGDTVEINDSEIAKGIQYLSVSLHGKKYGSLFDPYNSDPFMTFPKFCLNRKIAKLTTWPPVINYDPKSKKISCRFDFDGTEKGRIELRPSGFDSPISGKTVVSGQNVVFDIAKQYFNSYNVLLFAQENDEVGLFSETSFFTSKAIKVDSSLLRNKLRVTHFILDNGEKIKVNYSIYFAKPDLIGGAYYFVSKLINSTNGSATDDIMASVTEDKGAALIISLHHRVNGKILSLKLRNGHLVKGAIVDRLGG